MTQPRSLNLGFSTRVPLILQSESSECGLACLAMVANYHGANLGLSEMRQQFAISLKGATLSQLIDTAGRLGLTARALRLEMDDFQNLSRPCILHWDFNHFVVLTDVRRDRVTILDPGSGEHIYSFAEISQHFTGVALELKPTEQFTRRKESGGFKWRSLIGRTTGVKRSLLNVFVLALSLEVLSLTGPMLNQTVMDQVLVSYDANLLMLVAFGVIFIGALSVGISALRSWVVMSMGASINLQWASSIFTHMTRLPMSWFEKRHVGDIVSRFGSINAIQTTLTRSFVETALDGIMSIGAIAMMALYNIQLTLVCVVALAIYTCLRVVWYGQLSQITQSKIVLGAKEQSFFLETLHGIQSIRLFNAELDRRTRWLNLAVDVWNADLKTQRLDVLFHSLQGFLIALESTLVIWMGAVAVMENTWSIGMLFAFIAYKDQFSTRVTGLVEKAITIKMLRIHGERLSDIVLTEAEPDTGDGTDIANAPAEIEVKHVSFRYGPKEQWVIRDCSFKVSPGESVALVGASGCGKTTLLKIMLGLLEPEEGEVCFAGSSLPKAGLRQFRDQIGAVMQNDALFAGSIADNICFFSLQPDQARIEQCARFANIALEITAMPMGYNTLIGDMGSSLSGGQKQRILLARALYKKPRALFLDEATSHLDVQNEAMVNEAVRALGITTIIIAHRPETIRMADRVIVIDGGKAVELRPAPRPTVSSPQMQPA